jgi:hypothetical protein
LILCGGSDVAFQSKVAKELGYLIRAHLSRMPGAVKEDVSLDPADIRVLGPPAIVLHTDRFPNLIQQPWLAR